MKTIQGLFLELWKYVLANKSFILKQNKLIKLYKFLANESTWSKIKYRSSKTIFII